jgi:hypothetical protein
VGVTEVSTWKLTIKPDSKSGADPLKFCRDNGLIGIGWHHAYVQEDGGHYLPDSVEAALNCLHAHPPWKSDSLSVAHRFLEYVKPGDLVWVHQAGKYWVCKVQEELLFGFQISPDYQVYDLGQARRAIWREIEPELINGSIQRGCIAPITMQAIKVKPVEQAAYDRLHEIRERNPGWKPSITDTEVMGWLAPNRRQELLTVLTPDDHEDLVAYYLQSQGWFLKKSTCFRSHPKFEFQMHRPTGEQGYVQVKTGQSTLDALQYQEDAERGIVFLHASEVRNLEMVPNVIELSLEEIMKWVRQNLWAIGGNIRLRLGLFQDISSESLAFATEVDTSCSTKPKLQNEDSSSLG